MKYSIIAISILVLVGLCGVACAETAASPVAGSTTNVIFGKMITKGTNYVFEPYLTQYTGTNDWGRYTFVVGTEKLEKGNYSLMQQTPNGLELVQSYHIDPSGSTAPEYVQMTLAVGKDELPVPLQFTGTPAVTSTPASVQTPAAVSTTAASSVPQATALTPAAAATKSPMSPIIVLAALGICGIFIATFRRI